MMKITILQTHLISALAKANKVISSKPQLPILQSVLLEAKGNEVSITGTNTETTIVVKTSAKVDQEGGVCVPAKILTEFVATLPEEPIKIMEKEGALQILCDGYDAEIPALNKAEFPKTTEDKKGKYIELKKDDFISSMDSVLFAAATDEGRPILTGVKIKKTGEEAVIVATDGYRLSLKRAPLPLVEGEDVVVPAKTLQEVVKISQETKESENINIKEAQGAQLCFLIGDTEIYTRVIDGEYPNFEKIIPKQHQTRCVFQKDQLLNAVKSVSIFARDSANIIKFHIENGETVLSANTPQVGKNKVTIPTEVDGEGGDIAFNSRFILEFLNHLQDEQFIFEMTGSLNSGVFKRVKDDDFLHIIMPVRTAA